MKVFFHIEGGRTRVFLANPSGNLANGRGPLDYTIAGVYVV